MFPFSPFILTWQIYTGPYTVDRAFYPWRRSPNNVKRGEKPRLSNHCRHHGLLRQALQGLLSLQRAQDPSRFALHCLSLHLSIILFSTESRLLSSKALWLLLTYVSSLSARL